MIMLVVVLVGLLLMLFVVCGSLVCVVAIGVLVVLLFGNYSVWNGVCCVGVMMGLVMWADVGSFGVALVVLHVSDVFNCV